jgi:Tfp pilus assembly PilM family ATPase
MSPFLKQLSISKDFIERHQGCRISKAYVSGGCALIPHLSTVLGQELQSEVVLWNPLEKIRYERGAIPKTLAGQGSRFAAAIGAAIGGLLQ